jgi:hypothetical protein
VEISNYIVVECQRTSRKRETKHEMIYKSPILKLNQGYQGHVIGEI